MHSVQEVRQQVRVATQKVRVAEPWFCTIVQYYINFIVTTPDSVFLIYEWKLFLRGPDASCLVFNFSYTGSQMYEYESSCLLQDKATGYVKDPKNTKHTRKRVAPSVAFKKTSRNRKYEARKRNRQHTIGVYVDCTRVTTDEYKGQTVANTEEEGVSEEGEGCGGGECVYNTRKK
ncbi:hypothetical protein EON65_39925 [archaeon]|nr:MAG: hypothetical protein EON65_39925 [archaeon]